MTVIPIIVGELGTVLDSMEKRLKELEIKNQDYINQSIVKETSCHADSSERPPAYAAVINLLGVK